MVWERRFWFNVEICTSTDTCRCLSILNYFCLDDDLSYHEVLLECFDCNQIGPSQEVGPRIESPIDESIRHAIEDLDF